MRIGVLGCSDIAKRRMIPAIKKNKNFEYVGVAIASRTEWSDSISEEEYKEIRVSLEAKANEFIQLFEGSVYKSYEEILDDSSIDVIYIPLPPALHYYWAKKALEKGKHVLLEKPFTTNLKNTEELLSIAVEKKLAVTENYGFIYHSQFALLKKMLNENKIGELRLIRATFGFPHRLDSDFRYSKKFGGGALLDCGGYTIKAVSSFMDNPIVVTSSLSEISKHDVDVYGSVTIKDKNIVAQVAFGMDNSYKCDFELWGSEGALISKRAFTAPDNFETSIELSNKDGNSIIPAGKDDQFFNILERFSSCIKDSKIRTEEYSVIRKQSKLIESVFEKSKA